MTKTEADKIAAEYEKRQIERCDKLNVVNAIRHSTVEGEMADAFRKAVATVKA